MGQVVLGYIRKPAEQKQRTSHKTALLHSLCFPSCFQAPALSSWLTSLDDVSHVNPFLPKLALVFCHSNREHTICVLQAPNPITQEAETGGSEQIHREYEARLRHMRSISMQTKLSFA